MVALLKVAVYAALALVVMILGGKKIKEEPEYPDTKTVEADIRFLESLQFWPSWRDMPNDTLLGLKEESLDLLEEGITLESIKDGLLGRFPDNAVEYFLNALTGIYLDEQEAA